MGMRICPIDNFQLVLFTSTTYQNSKYFVCPRCFNDSPFPEISSNLSCNLCPKIECEYSVPHNKLTNCKKCQKGVLILDQNPGVRPSLSCNYCTKHVIIGDDINTIHRSKKQCETCKTNLLKVNTIFMTKLK